MPVLSLILPVIILISTALLSVNASPVPYVDSVLRSALTRSRRSTTCADLLAVDEIPEVAHAFNIFSNGDITLRDSNVGGRSFAMNNFIATQSTFAHLLPSQRRDCVGQESNPTPKYASAIALNNAKMVDSNAYAHVIYGQAYTGQQRLLAEGCKYHQITTSLSALYSSVASFISSTLNDISAKQASALTASECANHLNPSQLRHGSVLCLGTSNGWNSGEGVIVVDVEKNDLQSAYSVQWCDPSKIPGKDTNIILNVRGTGTIEFKANIDQLLVNGVTSNRINWNFFQADKVLIKHTTTKGNYVAPKATVEIFEAHVDGQVTGNEVLVEFSTVTINTRFVPPKAPK